MFLQEIEYKNIQSCIAFVRRLVPGNRFRKDQYISTHCYYISAMSLATWGSFCLKCYTSNFRHINLYFPIFQLLILAYIVMWISKCFLEKPVHAASTKRIHSLIFHGIKHFQNIILEHLSQHSTSRIFFLHSHWQVLVNSESIDCSS